MTWCMSLGHGSREWLDGGGGRIGRRRGGICDVNRGLGEMAIGIRGREGTVGGMVHEVMD